MSVFRLKFEEAYNDGYRRFISGMADGVDLACAVIIQEMIDSDRFPEMELVCAVPYLEQSQELKGGAAKYYYRSLVEASRYVVLVSVKENKQRYKLRNQFMVDNSSLVIGAYKYKPCGSGTQQTINMAKRAGIRTDLIHLDNNPLFYGKYSEDEPDSDTIIKGE
jgi:uncharacterized phage-like protein YoqJ